MKKASKLICLVLALVMVLALAACGSSSGNTGSTSTGTTSGTTSSGGSSSGASSTVSKDELVNAEKQNAALDTPVTAETDYSDKFVVINVGYHNSSYGDISPWGVPGSAKINYMHQIYETLCVQTEVGQSLDDMFPVIAKSWERLDEMTIQFELYDYVVDSEGNPIDAEDVAFCFNTSKELGNLTMVGCLDYAEATGDYTVVIHMKSAALGEIENMIQNVGIVSKAAYDANEGMNNVVVATGPYIMADMVPGSTMTLVKNEGYWQTDSSLRSPYSKQNADEIHYQTIAENNQMAIALETGEIATTTSTKAALVGSFVNDDGSAKDGFLVELNASTKSWCLLFNGKEESPLSDNLALRQAVCYAMNPEDFIYVGQKGVANVVYDEASQICADALDAWKDEDYYNYSVEKGIEKRNEAGYKEGELTLRILSANNDSDKLISQLIQANLADIGINAEIVTYDTALFNTARNSCEGWDITTDKPMGDYCPVVWNVELNKNNFSTGGTRTFFVDDELQALLELVASNEGHTEENLQKTHEYIRDTAYVYSFSSGDDFLIGNESILKTLGYMNYGAHQILPGACEFTDEYLESCPSK